MAVRMLNVLSAALALLMVTVGVNAAPINQLTLMTSSTGALCGPANLKCPRGWEKAMTGSSATNVSVPALACSFPCLPTFFWAAS